MRKIFVLAVLAGFATSCVDTEKYENEISSLQTELETMQATMNEVIEANKAAETEAKTEFDATGIAVVDMEKLLEKYTGYLEASKRFEARASQYQKELEKMGKEYETQAQIIRDEMNNFGQEYAAPKIQKLQEFEREIATKQQEYTQKAAKLEQDMLKAVLKKVNGHAKKYAEANGYQMIYFTSIENGIFYAKEDINITDEFIVSLNEADAAGN